VPRSAALEAGDQLVIEVTDMEMAGHGVALVNAALIPLLPRLPSRHNVGRASILPVCTSAVPQDNG
jgi:hypothetical protein